MFCNFQKKKKEKVKFSFLHNGIVVGQEVSRIALSKLKSGSESLAAKKELQIKIAIMCCILISHSLILSREGLILTLSILSCSQGWIS